MYSSGILLLAWGVYVFKREVNPRFSFKNYNMFKKYFIDAAAYSATPGY